LLGAIGLNFEVIPSEYEEDETLSTDPHELVAILARGKAEAAAEKLRNEDADAIVIAGDTTVAFEGQIIGKARHNHEAFQFLRQFAGHTHQLITGGCVVDVQSGQMEEFVDETEVTFAPLTDEDIWHYLEFNDEYRGRAGAYSLQDRASLFVTNITGSPTNVIGLPISKLREVLLKFGIDLLAGDYCTS
jgi:septum formation protein